MANVTGGSIGDTWSLQQFTGQLFTASAEDTPLLTMIGGLTGGGKKTGNMEFPISQEYAYETIGQPAITETASLTAPNPISYVRTQYVNTTQVFHESVALSYVKMANNARLTATEVSTSGYGYYDPSAVNPIQSELDFQIATQLKHIARDVEFSFINGAYAQATSVSVAPSTRGLIECASNASNTLAAGSATLSKTQINYVLRTMYANGAKFTNPVIFVNAFQKQMLSSIFGYAPMDRNVGGVNIKQIETDFGSFGIQLSRYMDTDEVLIADLAYVSPVFQEVPGKGLLFYEPLSKAGAKESGQIFGMIGVDHGPYFMHGSITGLATS
jgi:hypothetical protein